MSDATIKQVNYSIDGQSVNYLRNFLLDTDAPPTDQNPFELKLDPADNRLKYHDGTQLKELAFLSDVGGTVSLVPEDVTLANLDADTWTDFPVGSDSWFNYQIFLADEEISDRVLIRDNGGIYQLKSSVAMSNLIFRYV